MADIFNMADTWNAGATTFTAIKMNVTDTASAAGSLLMDLQVGGSSIARIAKNGNMTLSGTSSIAAVIFSTAQFRTGSLGIGHEAAGGTAVVAGNADFSLVFGGIGSSGVLSVGTRYIGFANTSGSAADVTMFRDAADILAQRRGTNAQTKRIYGTYTDASNGRWVELAVTTAGVASIRATGNGTGASGNVLHISSLPTSNPGPGILWNNAGTPAIGT